MAMPTHRENKWGIPFVGKEIFSEKQGMAAIR